MSQLLVTILEVMDALQREYSPDVTAIAAPYSRVSETIGEGSWGDVMR
jgi:hypothetical protein